MRCLIWLNINTNITSSSSSESSHNKIKRNVRVLQHNCSSHFLWETVRCEILILIRWSVDLLPPSDVSSTDINIIYAKTARVWFSSEQYTQNYPSVVTIVMQIYSYAMRVMSLLYNKKVIFIRWYVNIIKLTLCRLILARSSFVCISNLNSKKIIKWTEWTKLFIVKLSP